VSALRAASVRHLLRHPAQLALALIGLALGVGTIVAVDIATESARRAFELSLQAINGAATHEIEGSSNGIDERLYARLRIAGLPGQGALSAAPLVSGYVTVGERVLQLIGLDPPASRELAGEGGGSAPAAALADRALARQWFTSPGAVIMSAQLARELAIGTDGHFDLSVGGVAHPATLIARLDDAGPGFDGLILTDIAQAQEWLHGLGRLSRIDLRIPPDSTATLLARLKSLLPADLTITSTRAAARETFAMTDAFTTNLRAMSLLALLVGTLLIYGSVSFAVLERAPIIGVLRALGTTRREILTLVLGEAALLGIAGAALGVLLGIAIGHALVGLVSQTINDLYFVVAVRQVSVPPRILAEALAAGVATALIAAWLPARELAGSTPRLSLTRSVLESRVREVARALAFAGALLALAAGLTVVLSGRSLLAGFAALFLLLVSVAAMTPLALRALALAAARLAAARSPVARLALSDVGNSLSRTGVAIAALGMALAAMIGVAVMVESFRESLREWLTQTMRADVYVSAPGVAESLERRLEPGVIRALLEVPGVRAHSEGRRVEVASPAGPIDVNAVALAPQSQPGFRFTQGDPEAAWRAFAHGGVLISEPLAWRLSLAPGRTLSLTTAEGNQAFTVAGVYREYANERGEVLMDLKVYRQYWHDEAVAGLGLYLEPGVDAAGAVQALFAAVHGRQALLIRSNADIRALSMRIFERTFVITRVLYWLAAGVASLGLLSALLAWQLTRARELALLRTLGLTPAGSAVLGLAQTLFMAIAAFLVALPAGILTALVLTDVINRRAFGWQLDLHLTAAQFSNALWLALASALAAGLYPAWRSARAPLAAGLREE
jgi:putative ABC transport system permease protein